MKATEPEAGPFMRALGARVQASRKCMNWTLRQLGERVGMSQSGIFQIEHGTSMPGAGTLWRLSRALQVSIDWIVTGKEYPEPAGPCPCRD